MCIRDRLCLIAQESCIGARAFKSFDKNTRIAISECQVNSYLCVLERSKNCETTKSNCVSKIIEKVKKMAINTYEKVIEKVADGITSMATREELSEGTIYVELKNNASLDLPKDKKSDMIIVTKAEASNEARIMLTAVDSEIQFDLEGKEKLQIEIETADINEVEIEKQKLVTKQRIKEALRKILIVSKNGNRNPLNSLQVTSDIPATPSQDVNLGAETPLSSSSPGVNQNRKSTKDHVGDLLIDGVLSLIHI